MMDDVTHAARNLIRAPGYSAAVVLILALGIGAATTIFSVVNGVLLRPLPFPDQERVLMLWQQAPGVSVTQDWFSPAQYFDLREQVSSFEDLALVWGRNVTLSGDGEKPTRVGALAVSSSFFRVLGITPALGRPLTAMDDVASATLVVVLGHEIFTQRFGGNPKVVGTTITVDGLHLEVVGVLPPMVLDSDMLPTLLPIASFDFVMSLPMGDPQIMTHGSENFNILAKLAPEATPRQLDTELMAVAEIFSKDPGSLAAGLEPGTGYRIAAVPLIDQVAGKIRLPLLVLLGGTGLLLAIACVNVANLILTRAATEHRQLSIRAALGAGRARMIRQSMLQSLILSLFGGVAGLGIAAIAVRALHGVAPQDLPRLRDVGIDPAVLLFAGVICLAATLLFGAVPALRISSVAPNEVLCGAGLALGALPLWRRGGSRYLVVVQVALSMMLVTGAGLLMRSVRQLQAVDPGFRSEKVLSFRLSLAGERYMDSQARFLFYDQLLNQLRSLAGVEDAGGSTLLPLTPLYSWTDFIVEGYEPVDDRERVVADTQIVTPGYFETMGIPLLAGRTFDDNEKRDTLAAIVDRTFAESFWSVDEAVGKWIVRFPGEIRFTIVGVVDSVKHYGLAADPHLTVFFPHKAVPAGTLFCTMRTTGEPLATVSAVVDTIQELDSDMPVYDIQTMSQRVERSLATERSLAALLNLFGGVALVLASAGLYGVLSFSVAAHTHEIGIRKALGARNKDLHGLVLARAGVLTLSGIALGMVAALLAESIFKGLVYGISTTDPLSFAASAALVAGVALAASVLPARRAAHVDPLIALKTD
jgi:predicted permease